MFFPVSLGVHLLLFSTVSLFFPDLKVDQFPILPLEVSLLPAVTQQEVLPKEVRSSTPPVRKEKKNDMPSPDAQVEVKEEPILPPPRAMEVKETERKESEEKKETDLLPKEIDIPSVQEIVVASLSQDFPLRNNPSSQGFERSAALPSPPEGEIIFIQPRYAENPKPPYPSEARRKGYHGEVLLRVEVLPNGQVGEIELKKSSGHEVLDRSALNAVRAWRFIPARKGQTPVSLWVNIPIRFQLQ
jgi:protein TonB